MTLATLIQRTADQPIAHRGWNSSWWVWIIIGFMVANVGVYGTQAVFWTIPQSYMSRQSAPGAIGLVSTIGSIGGATIPIVIGRAKDASGSFTIGFLCVSAVLVFAAVLILIARTQLVKK